MALTKHTIALMAAVAVAVTVLCLPASTCGGSIPVRCTKAELSSCYCGRTTYDRQELYAVNCTSTGLSFQKSLDVLMNLPDEIEVIT